MLATRESGGWRVFAKSWKLAGKTRICRSMRTSKTTSNWKDLKLNIHLSLRSLKFRCWQRAIFPGGGPPSIFASVGLYDCVRDGNRWFTYDWPPTNFLFADADYLQLQLYAEDCTRYIIINLTFSFCVVFRHLLAFAFANATRDFTPPYGLEKALVRLVMLGWKCCHSYTCILSTSSSTTGLTDLCHERSHLTVGFVLICFQHLSAWNTATGRLLLAE